MIEKVIDLKEWFVKQKISFRLYTTALALTTIAVIISALTKNFLILELSILLMQIFFIFGMLIDSIEILKKLYNTFYEKIVYALLAVIAYFTYIQSEALAKNAIYSVVKTNPDLFETSINYLAGLYFVPSLFIVLAPLVVVAFFISMILFAFYPILEIFKKNKEDRVLWFHIVFYLLGVTAAIMGFLRMDVEGIYKKIWGENYITAIILKYDYHKNQTCDGGSVYIKYLDNNLISKTNINELHHTFFGVRENLENANFQNVPCK